MPTIGNSTQPSSQIGTAAGAIYLQRVQSASVQTLNSIQGWSSCPNANWAEQIYLVYSDNAGAPDELLAQSAPFFASPETMAQRSANLITPLALASGAYYWIGTQIEHDSAYVATESSSGATSYNRFGGSFGSPPADLTGSGAVVNDSRIGFSGTTEVISGLTIDSTPADIRVTESRTIRVTAPTTAMTTGNTAVRIDDAGNDPITPSAVTNISGLTYDVVFTVPDEYAGLPYSATGYPIIVTTTDGSVTSGNVDFLPVTGNGDVTLTDVSDTDINSSPALEVDDQIEWTNAAVITIGADGKVYSTEESTTFEFRVWDHNDSTWGDWAEVIFGGGGGGGGGDIGLVINGLTTVGLTIAGLTS